MNDSEQGIEDHPQPRRHSEISRHVADFETSSFECSTKGTRSVIDEVVRVDSLSAEHTAHSHFRAASVRHRDAEPPLWLQKASAAEEESAAIRYVL